MIRIVTWNIQCGRGVDGRVDLSRIARVLRSCGELDVICLQEVARHLPELDGGRNSDQVAELQALLPEHEAHFGAALDLAAPGGGRARFGNLVLARLPVVQCFRHLLPEPADPSHPHMPRQATEVVVETGRGTIRVMTTHLEYHGSSQRLAQVERLREIQKEVAANDRMPPDRSPGGLYGRRPRPMSCVLCGDFNMLPDDDAYRLLTAPLSPHDPPFIDAWRHLHGTVAHAPSCGVRDRRQWPQGPHCRDFFLVTADLAREVRRLCVEQRSDASDHQPLLLELACSSSPRSGRG